MKLSKCLKGNEVHYAMIMNDLGCLVFEGDLEYLGFYNNEFYNNILNMKVINFFINDDRVFTIVEE